MTYTSRTAKSLQNVKVALIFYFLNLLLQFFSRKIFLDYLGSEVLGLNTTAQNLLGFLNLAELGIGTAVSYNLYKPLFDGNRKAINGIVAIQGWLYRRIAYVVIAGAVVLMCFFPLIFAKVNVPLWYTYGSFIALLTSALLGYFVNYRQIVLSADQKEYKVTYCLKGGMAVKITVQMVAIYLLDNGYVWWMAIETASAFFIALTLNHTIRKEYPWLAPNLREGGELRKQYPQIITKTKQVFFHKIGGAVLAQTSPLVIYAYTSLTIVAVYGNYMLIVMGVTALMNALLNGITAGIGNLVAEGDKQKIKSVFWEITFLRMWLASMVCFGMYMSGDSFIILWVGDEYLLPNAAFALLIAITFINLTRTNDAFLAAYGLYKDVWAPVTEAILNLGCSILLGYFFGIVGILVGVLISLLIIVCGWKPYFLFRDGFKQPVWEYILHYGKYLLLFVGLFIGNVWLSGQLFSTEPASFVSWTAYLTKILVLYGLSGTVLLYALDSTARRTVKRIYQFTIR